MDSLFSNKLDARRNSLQILQSLDDLTSGAKIKIFGAGETGQEFVKLLRRHRPDVHVLNFFDTYKSGAWSDIPIEKYSKSEIDIADVPIVIASVYWGEIFDLLKSQGCTNHKILSNSVIHQGSHLSAYGDFYYDAAGVDDLETRFERIARNFPNSADIAIFRNIFELRLYKKEVDFYAFAKNLIDDEKRSFSKQEKYSRHLALSSVAYVIEGGVYDGHDTYQLLNILKNFDEFKKIYAFEPFIDALKNGAFIDKIDANSCEFFEDVLWDRKDEIAFVVDKANPANSKVVSSSELTGFEHTMKKCHATSIDIFLKKIGKPVDLIKLDVEGSELTVLRGAREAILKYKPKLAISIYHCKEHLLDIPDYLLSLHENYEFKMSMNNSSFVDAVLYAT
jgi:FkbM family methyltransferase